METFTLVKATVLYWARVLPYARGRVEHWERRSRVFADPVVRKVAQAKMAGERGNLESAAFFALLAGANWRTAVERIIVFQAIYELLDGLNELYPAFEDGLRLRVALETALVEPSEVLQREVRRVGEAQARNHAREDLRAWAEAFAPNLAWWEAAAAGISSLCVLAMLATPSRDHRAIAEAYRPVDALASLLDALVDLPSDRQTGNHNWLDHYGSEQHAAVRLAGLAKDALERLARLPNAPVHRMILAGLLAHNLVATHGRAPGVESGLRNALPLATVGVVGLKAQRAVLQSSTVQRFSRLSHQFR